MNNVQPGFDTVVFGFVLGGIKLFLTPVHGLLQLIYLPCQFLIIPLFMILFAFSCLWLVCLVMIKFCAYLARVSIILRCIAFLVALPFVIIGAIVIALVPMPSPMSYVDREAKMHVILAYPCPANEKSELMGSTATGPKCGRK